MFVNTSSVIAFSDVDNQVIDQITNFDSKITINKDTSITIEEELTYNTNKEKHGIYRYIPYRYKQVGLSYTTRISDIKITDDHNNKIPYKKSFEYGNIMLKIGNPDVTFTGQKKYKLSYRVNNAVQHVNNHDELFWDITGEGWRIPVLKTHAIIVSKFANIIDVNCYSGMVGTDDGLCQSSFDQYQAEFSYNENIENGINMTVAIALDQNDSQLIFPGILQNIWITMIDNIILLIISLPTMVVLFIWYTRGRDWQFISPNVFNLSKNQPRKLTPIFYRSRIPLVYEPLDLTPGEAGTILDQRVDNKDIVAEIISLVSQGYMSIKSIEEKKVWGKKKNYIFNKLRDANSAIPKHQKYLLNAIFERGGEVKLSNLKGTFYKQMSEMKDLLYLSVFKHKLFTANPSDVRALLLTIFVVLDIIIIIIGVYAIDQYLTTMPFILSLILSVINILFAWQMPQRTAVGTAYMMQVKGLKQTIQRGYWREKVKEKHLFIEEILPYAIALGVVKQLSRDMQDLNIKPPEYLQSNILNNIFIGDFLSDFNSTVGSSLAYNPSSSSYSSGSGFSGGFSGGGGGGGGGGSW